jgi:hypothetical protein
MIDNYEWVKWVFSGIGVLVVSLIISMFIKKRKLQGNSTSGNNSPIIIGNKNRVKAKNGSKRR